MLRPFAVVAAFLFLAVASTVPASADVKFERLTTPKSLPPFALEDQAGRPYAPAQFKGHWTLLFMGYTSCPDICPYTLANLAAVRSALSKRAAPTPLPTVVFFAVDPARDKPILKEYLADFDPDFVGITGSLDAIQRLVDGIGGYVHRDAPDKDGEYAVSHTAAVSVVDPDARIVGTLLPPFQPDGTANRLAAVFLERLQKETVGTAGR